MDCLNKDEVFNFLKENKKALMSFGVKQIGIFGSYVKNNQKDESDIDILVEFNEKDLSYDNFISLAFFLEDKLNKEIDLVTKDSLSPYIGPNIMKEVEYVSL